MANTSKQFTCEKNTFLKASSLSIGGEHDTGALDGKSNGSVVVASVVITSFLVQGSNECILHVKLHLKNKALTRSSNSSSSTTSLSLFLRDEICQISCCIRLCFGNVLIDYITVLFYPGKILLHSTLFWECVDNITFSFFVRNFDALWGNDTRVFWGFS